MNPITMKNLVPCVTGALVAVSLTAFPMEALAGSTVPEEYRLERRESRLAHARELLGRHYSRSVVSKGEGIHAIDSTVAGWVLESLGSKWGKKAPDVAKAVVDEGLKHGLDPLLLLAVIQSESQFNPEARGDAGEIGLMQIMPSTAKWFCKKIGFPWNGDQTLLDPVKNIQIGTAYIAYLRDRFDSHARLYLAAYNMGSANVRGALGRSIWPKDYPSKVMHQYIKYYRQLMTKNETTS